MKRPIVKSMARGFACACPSCGKGPMMASYLKVADSCTSCGEDFTPQSADDAPPYFTIIIVGHIIVPLILLVEMKWSPPMVPSMIGWCALIIALTFWLMPRVKGAIVGLQWALRLGDFGKAAHEQVADLRE